MIKIEHNKALTITFLICTAILLGSIILSTTSEASSTWGTVNSMPKNMRHTWYHGHEKIRITAHTLSFATVGHKFTYVNHFKKVNYNRAISGKFKGHLEFLPNLNADIPIFIYSHGKLFPTPQNGPWLSYHR